MSWLAQQAWSKWALLGLVASAAVMALGYDDEVAPESAAKGNARQIAAAPASSSEAAKPSAAEARVELELILRQQRQPQADKQIGNAFNMTSWYVPPPPLPLPVHQPPKPTAPPLPFTYFGEYQYSGAEGKVIFLASAERVYTVSEGDVIDSTYSVGPIVAGQLELTYLPLNIKQSLNTGGVL